MVTRSLTSVFSRHRVLILSPLDGHTVDDLSPKQIDRLIAYVSSLLATKTDIGDDLSTRPRADLGPDWSDDDAPAETDQSQGQIEGERIRLTNRLAASGFEFVC